MKPVTIALWAVCVAVWVSIEALTAAGSCESLSTLPQQIEASKITAGKVTRTRPLCPYPQVARYKGTGSIDEAANFTCVAP